MAGLEFDTRDEASDAAIAQQLREKPLADAVYFNLEDEERDNWPSTIQALGAMKNLKRMDLVDSDSPQLVCKFLKAIQRSPVIQHISLVGLELPDDFPTLLPSTGSLTSLAMGNCYMTEQGRDSLIRMIPTLNLKTLCLTLRNFPLLVTILQGLRTNTTLESLSVDLESLNLGGFSGMEAVYGALVPLVGESDSSITKWGFRSLTTSASHDGFQAVAEGLKRNRKVCHLEFRNCHFGQTLTNVVRDLLQNQTEVVSLHLDQCRFYQPQGLGQPLVFGSLGSRLETLELSQNRAFLDRELPNLLTVIQRSKLQSLKIGAITTRQEWQSVIQSIPSMRIGKLVIDSIVYTPSDDDKQQLLVAIDRNYSLVSVEVMGSRMFNDDQKAKLKFCADRNGKMQEWIGDPGVVADPKLWPEALHLADEAGQDSLYRGLRSVLQRKGSGSGDRAGFY